MNKVKVLRSKKGLNQRQLAELSHTPQSLISALERGKVKPWVKLAERLSIALDVPIDEIFPHDIKSLNGSRNKC